MLLYRIAYSSKSVTHSVVRPLPTPPLAGDRITVDARTVVTVRKVVPHSEGDTIAAEVLADASDAPDEVARQQVTGSASRSSR
jgi:hypothetical protein